jgi:hypothetical protein
MWRPPGPETEHRIERLFVGLFPRQSRGDLGVRLFRLRRWRGVEIQFGDVTAWFAGTIQLAKST